MTTLQQNAISDPAAGLQIYNTTLSQPHYLYSPTYRKLVLNSTNISFAGMDKRLAVNGAAHINDLYLSGEAINPGAPSGGTTYPLGWNPISGQVEKYTQWPTVAAGTVKGTGVAGQVAYWTGSDSITGSEQIVWRNNTLSIGINPDRWLVNSGGNPDVLFSSGITLNDSSKAISIPRYNSPGGYRRIYMYNSASDGLVFGGISNDGSARTRLYNNTGNSISYIELNNYDNSYGGTYFYQPVKNIGILSPANPYTEYKFVGGSSHHPSSMGGRNEFMGLFPQVATHASVENIGFSVNAYTTAAVTVMRL